MAVIEDYLFMQILKNTYIYINVIDQNILGFFVKYLWENMDMPVYSSASCA